MKRNFRLIKSTDFKRVRRFGKSYAHPLIVLIKHPNESDRTRFGISTNRSVGNAVQRNRVKRQFRAMIRPILPTIQPGWDIILLARKPITGAPYVEINSALHHLLKRADLLNELNVNENPVR